MRPVNLTVVEGGIQRLREKGGANEKSLWDLVNGYITADRKIRNRPGTARVASLPASTKGLCSFKGTFHVFSHESVSVPAGYTLHVLQHPEREDQNGDPIEIKRIHFARPFMNALYVVAEFDVDPATEPDIDENVYHYWLQGEGNVWEANTEYRAGKLVSPTTPNGLFFRATRLGEPDPSWTPNTPVAQGDRVEPTVYNNFYFEAIQVLGTAARTGDVEPSWPTTSGEQVIEDVSGTENQGNPTPPEVVITPELDERYANSILGAIGRIRL